MILRHVAERVLVTRRPRRDAHRGVVDPQVSDLVTRVRQDHERRVVAREDGHAAGQRLRGPLTRDPAAAGHGHRDRVGFDKGDIHLYPWPSEPYAAFGVVLTKYHKKLYH